MAKSYSPNEALIRGAAAAYKNWDNVPGMYAGIQKAIQGGIDVMKKQTEIGLQEMEKREKASQSWDQVANQVVLKAGSLGDKLYNATYNDVLALKEQYLEASYNKDERGKMNALRALSNYSTFIQDHKQLNLDYADGKLENLASDAMTADEMHIVSSISGQNYESVYRGEDGQMYFDIIMPDETIISVSHEQYEGMFIHKSLELSNKTSELISGSYRNRIFDKDNTYASILNTIGVTDKEIRAALHDPILGGKFADMLRADTTIEQELVDLGFADGDGVIDENEMNNFINAITDHTNPGYNKNLSRKILAEKLTNAVQNKHSAYWNEYDRLQQEANDKKTKNQSMVLPGMYKTYEEQDSKIDQALRGETIYDWAGNEWEADGAGNFTGNTEGGPTTLSLYKLLSSPYFGLNERLRSRGIEERKIVPWGQTEQDVIEYDPQKSFTEEDTPKDKTTITDEFRDKILEISNMNISSDEIKKREAKLLAEYRKMYPQHEDVWKNYDR
jgi:hypothetical protein